MRNGTKLRTLDRGAALGNFFLNNNINIKVKMRRSEFEITYIFKNKKLIFNLKKTFYCKKLINFKKFKNSLYIIYHISIHR